MEPQEGKLGNIDHLTPGMIGISDTNNPVTHGALSYRAATAWRPTTTPGTGTSTTASRRRTSPGRTPSRWASTTPTDTTRTRPTARRRHRSSTTSPPCLPPGSPTG
jgi:hypothetical protein